MDVTNLSFNDAEFDTVFVLEVLEHVQKPSLASTELHRVLKSTGKLLVSTLFIFGIHDAPYDYYRYTKYGLKYLFRMFEQETIRPRTVYFFTIFVLLFKLMMAQKVNLRLVGLLVTLVLVVFAPIVVVVDQFLPDNTTTGYVAGSNKCNQILLSKTVSVSIKTWVGEFLTSELT